MASIKVDGLAEGCLDEGIELLSQLPYENELKDMTKMTLEYLRDFSYQ